MKRNFAHLSRILLAVAIYVPCLSHATQVVYGLDKAEHFNQPTKGNLFIQPASFSIRASADKYRKELQAKTTYPVKVIYKNHFYTVVIGPIHSARSLRQIATHLLSPSTNAIMDQKARWFFSLNIGEQFQTGKKTMYVNNGSDYPSPYNQDTYTMNKTARAPLINISGGYRWQREQNWLPVYSLGLFYQHSFVGQLGGEVIQYSDSIFTNYNYKSNLSSNLFLATAKVNIYTINKFSPYITVGLGGAFNHASYNETALPGVTPRISPDFTGNKSQFAYNAGAGLDYIASQHFIFNVGYLYQNVGNISGQGQGTWSGTSLGFGAYGTNDVVVGVTYLFGE